jgi:8-oxo-dGTP pyrophosphatase MutT (NUDIX family)
MGRGGKKVLSCGAVVVRDTPQGRRILMLRAFSHWDFPKGICESGETPRQCMLREVREETALDDLDFPWGEAYVETGPYSRGKVARYYLAKTGRSEIAMLPNPETGRAEHVEYRWCTLAEATRLAAPRVKGVIAWATERLGAG